MRATHITVVPLFLLLAWLSAHAASENASQAVTIPATATAGDATEEGEVDLLKWALKHSDPKALKQQAEDAKLENRNDPDAEDRRARVSALLQAAKEMPTEAELMETALLVVQNSTESLANRSSALEALAVLVEPVDNADHLLKLHNATTILVNFLGTTPALEAISARVLGVAASNNAPFQEGLVARHPDVILRLVQLLSSSAEDTTSAALYAAGQILRNSAQARHLWAQATGGDVLVAMIKGGKQVTRKSRRRAVTLAGDLLQLDPGAVDSSDLAHALLSLLREQIEGTEAVDLDLLEKALEAVGVVQAMAGGKAALVHGGSEMIVRGLIAKLKKGEGKTEYVEDVIVMAEALIPLESSADD